MDGSGQNRNEQETDQVGNNEIWTRMQGASRRRKTQLKGIFAMEDRWTNERRIRTGLSVATLPHMPKPPQPREDSARQVAPTITTSTNPGFSRAVPLSLSTTPLEQPPSTRTPPPTPTGYPSIGTVVLSDNINKAEKGEPRGTKINKSDLREDGRQPSRSGNTAMTRNDDHELNRVQRLGSIVAVGTRSQHNLQLHGAQQSCSSSSSHGYTDQSRSHRLTTPKPFVTYFDTLDDLAVEAFPGVSGAGSSQLILHPEANRAENGANVIQIPLASDITMDWNQSTPPPTAVEEKEYSYYDQEYAAVSLHPSASSSHVDLPMLTDQGSLYSINHHPLSFSLLFSSFPASGSSVSEGSPWAHSSSSASGSNLNHLTALGDRTTDNSYTQQFGSISLPISAYSFSYQPLLGRRRPKPYEANQLVNLPGSSSASRAKNHWPTPIQKETHHCHYQSRPYPPSSSSSLGSSLALALGPNNYTPSQGHGQNNIHYGDNQHGLLSFMTTSTENPTFQSQAPPSTSFPSSSLTSSALGSSYLPPSLEQQTYHQPGAQQTSFPSSSSAPLSSQYLSPGQQGEVPPNLMFEDSTNAAPLFNFMAKDSIRAGDGHGNFDEVLLYDNRDRQEQNFSENYDADFGEYAGYNDVDGNSGYIPGDKYPQTLFDDQRHAGQKEHNFNYAGVH